jgi:hypothetical protein
MALFLKTPGNEGWRKFMNNIFENKYFINCFDLKYSIADKFDNTDRNKIQIIITKKYAGNNLLQRLTTYSFSELDDQKLLIIKKPLITKNPQTAICPSNNFANGYLYPDSFIE